MRTLVVGHRTIVTFAATQRVSVRRTCQSRAARDVRQTHRRQCLCFEPNTAVANRMIKELWLRELAVLVAVLMFFAIVVAAKVRRARSRPTR